MSDDDAAPTDATAHAIAKDEQHVLSVTVWTQKRVPKRFTNVVFVVVLPGVVVVFSIP